ncbi:acetyl esterase [Microbacterium sp. W4I4]|uniref:alpha/beta hydrolase fold domain-containing protein n=1 Tax=Microbacterium sp. W4I4 TaxID=3042295 RepID=UPI002787B555|nr:alpha/beta hydrolase [Microbacterium sp. W4I4]MDQ0613999.1 acetyl esterase [Microbacterium sp. W4I4]
MSTSIKSKSECEATIAAFEVGDLLIEGPHGSIPLRTYLPKDATQGLVWVHGGAFSFGGLDDAESDWVSQRIAASGIAVVAVDYRLAPVPDWLATATGTPTRSGVHFPVASEEVDAAFRWATTSTPGVAPSAWSLGGASAGAALASGAALRLRDSAGASASERPRTLVFAYGLFHGSLPRLRPEIATKFAALPPEAARLTPETLEALALNYVGRSGLLSEAYAFAGGHDLVGLPPVLLVNSDSDSIRASGEAFAAELAAASVDIAVVNEPGTIHGHLSTPDHPGAARSAQRIVNWLASRQSATEGAL